jgi:hypothetical protein
MMQGATASVVKAIPGEAAPALTLLALEESFVARSFDAVLQGCYRLLWRLTTAGSSPGEERAH